MVMGVNFLWMVIFIKANTNKENSMEMVSIYGKMVQCMMVNFLMVLEME
jgi:hypothetical protein